MYSPETFAASLGLMVLSMFCWGSWANAFSLARGKYRFELFYWDYAVGIMLGVLVLAALLGPQSAVFQGTMDAGKAAWGVASGVVFSIGTVLLVAAISLTGMAVAFPICIGLAMLIGGGVSWYIEAAVPAVPMALGLALILVSVILDAAAYRAMSGKMVASARGIAIALLGGVFTGAFPPCLQQAMVGMNPLDPYAAVVMLGVGVLGCTIVTNYAFMRRPIAGGAPVTMAQFFSASPRFHVFGILGGMVWAAGSVANFIAGGKVSVAISYAFGGGATIVTALWGIFLWKEFCGAPRRSYWYLCGMFVAFLAGITVIAWAKSTMPSGGSMQAPHTEHRDVRFSKHCLMVNLNETDT
jgi:glucose uptake protein